MRLPLQSIKGSLLLGVLLFPGLAHAQAGAQIANPVVMVIVLGRWRWLPLLSSCSPRS